MVGNQCCLKKKYQTSIFVQPACCERDIPVIVTMLLRCICMRLHPSIHPELLYLCMDFKITLNTVVLLNPPPNNFWFLPVCSTSLLKTLGEKEEIAHNEQFLLFPQCFRLSFQRTFRHFPQIENCCQQTVSVWKSPTFITWERVNE